MKLYVLMIFLLGCYSSWTQLSVQNKTLVISKIQGKPEKIQFEIILRQRESNGTPQRMDSIKYVELVLIENYNQLSKEFNTIEIYVKENDTITYYNGNQENVFGEYYLKNNPIKRKDVYRKVKFPFLFVLHTSGCIRRRKKQLKKETKEKLENTYSIKTKNDQNSTQKIILEYPVKKARLIFFRIHHGGY